MGGLSSDVLQDWDVNRGRRKAQVILVLYRLASLCHRDRLPRVPARLYIGFYKVLTNWFMGVELPPEATIGRELRLFHPHAIVVHPDTRMGARCTLRQCTTIGNVERVDGPSQPPVLGDDVDLGAGVLVIGERHIGDGATVGAGSVVVSDVPAAAVVVGNPARPLEGDPTDGDAGVPDKLSLTEE